MNNFVIGLKRFFTNKNVITVIGVIIALVILYYGYSSSIKKEINPINVPVAANKILPKQQITSADVKMVEVAASIIGEGVVRNSWEVVGKYANLNVTIPAGSMFYKEWLVEADKLPGNWIEKLNYEAGELGYYMSVNMNDTLGNNVLPNTYVDIYMKANDENGTPMFGKLLKNVKVLVVHDANGNDVFENSSSVGFASKIGFAVSPDLYILLNKAEYLNLDLIIAPRGARVPSEDSIIVTSSTLRDYIDAQTITVEEDIIVNEEENTNQDVNNAQNQPVVE